MANLWAAFSDLLPETPRLIGDIESLYGDGTATVVLLGGGSLRVNTNGVDVLVGDRVFLRGELIEATAPVLTPEIVEV